MRRSSTHLIWAPPGILARSAHQKSVIGLLDSHTETKVNSEISSICVGFSIREFLKSSAPNHLEVQWSAGNFNSLELPLDTPLKDIQNVPQSPQ